MVLLWQRIKTMWCWIGENQGQLTVLVTLAGVVVAWFYVRLTRRLARAARDQAEASRIAAQAAADQAHSTRLILEAAHRPWVEIEFDRQSSFFANPDRYRLIGTVHNHGSAPAILIRSRAVFRQGGTVLCEDLTPEPGLGIFPNREASLPGGTAGHGPVPTGQNVDVEIEVV